METKNSKTDNELQRYNRQQLTSHLYNPRPCPSCGETMYGMPGGRDAHCSLCGYKDPCCGEA